jgi:hypothetical protein
LSRSFNDREDVLVDPILRIPFNSKLPAIFFDSERLLLAVSRQAQRKVIYEVEHPGVTSFGGEQ